MARFDSVPGHSVSIHPLTQSHEKALIAMTLRTFSARIRTADEAMPNGYVDHLFSDRDTFDTEAKAWRKATGRPASAIRASDSTASLSRNARTPWKAPAHKAHEEPTAGTLVIGAAMTVRYQGTEYAGRVWSRGPAVQEWWIALDCGLYALTHGKAGGHLGALTVHHLRDGAGRSAEPVERVA